MQPRSIYLDTPLELVIIGGAYKSGTSLLCESIEAHGYRNPGLLTNPGEYGHGISAGLYFTRECSIARNWNRLLLNAGPKEITRIERQFAGYLSEMIGELGPKLVLKDPYMKMTALPWFRAAHLLGANNLTFLVTNRDQAAVNRSLAHSRFLTLKKRANPEQFRQLAAPINFDMHKKLSGLAVTTHVVNYQRELRGAGSNCFSGEWTSLRQPPVLIIRRSHALR